MNIDLRWDPGQPHCLWRQACQKNSARGFKWAVQPGRVLENFDVYWNGSSTSSQSKHAGGKGSFISSKCSRCAECWWEQIGFKMWAELGKRLIIHNVLLQHCVQHKKCRRQHEGSAPRDAARGSTSEAQRQLLENHLGLHQVKFLYCSQFQWLLLKAWSWSPLTRQNTWKLVYQTPKSAPNLPQGRERGEGKCQSVVHLPVHHLI